MKIALITDTHFGVRNDNAVVARHQVEFFRSQFIPYLESNGIEGIIHLGDLVDRRKYISFQTSRMIREQILDKLIAYPMFIIAGNHDTFFKNTNEINSLQELLTGRYPNITVIDSPSTIELDGLKILMLPWICDENREKSMSQIVNTDSQICMGHLELSGFEMYRGSSNEHGMDSGIFTKFDRVFSGHYHHKSSRANIDYLGAPFTMIWSDYNDPRGFHIFDTQSRHLQFVANTKSLFHKIDYDDTEKTLEQILAFDPEVIKDCYVKVQVIAKNNAYWFDLFISALEKLAVDIKVIEFESRLVIDAIDDIPRDMLSLLISNVSSNVELETYLKTLYNEACASE